MKLKYAMQLKRSSYLEVLSLEEWNVCLMTLNNNWGKILKFVNFLAFSEMSQLMAVMLPKLLIFIWMVFSDGSIEEKLLKTITLEH